MLRIGGIFGDRPSFFGTGKLLLLLRLWRLDWPNWPAIFGAFRKIRYPNPLIGECSNSAGELPPAGTPPEEGIGLEVPELDALEPLEPEPSGEQQRQDRVQQRSLTRTNARRRRLGKPPLSPQAPDAPAGDVPSEGELAAAEPPEEPPKADAGQLAAILAMLKEMQTDIKEFKDAQPEQDEEGQADVPPIEELASVWDVTAEKLMTAIEAVDSKVEALPAKLESLGTYTT